jgi:hypothetical protein
MPDYPSFTNLRPERCCEQALRDIKEKIELAEDLKIILGVSPFFTSLFTNPAITLFSLTSMDWDVWGKAVKSVNIIARSRCQDIAAFEVINHPGGELNRFWKAMYDSFM